MSLSYPVASDHQLGRLLQIGMVLEEVVEARAYEHHEALVAELDADPVAYEEIEELVAARYVSDTDFDGVLYDQLCNEETAYKFYDDLVAAIEGSDVRFGVDRGRLLTTLREIREEEKEGAEEVTELMEANV